MKLEKMYMAIQATKNTGSNIEILPKAETKANKQTMPRNAPIGNKINDSTLYRLVRNML